MGKNKLNTKRLYCPFEVKEITEAGVFSGYASVFGNIDAYGDMVMPGAFTKSLASKMPALLWQHDTHEPIGVWQGFKEDKKGLLATGQLLIDGVTRAREAYSLLKAGALNGLSIGYMLKKYEWAKTNDKEFRKLTEIDLWEVSLVTFPANDEARISDVKEAISELESVRDVEEYLREAGLSRSEAKGIISQLKAISLREAEKAAAVKEMKNLIKAVQSAAQR